MPRPPASPASAPMQADATGDSVAELPGSTPAGMISVSWYDLRPDQVTPKMKQAYAEAVQRLVPGAPAVCAHVLGAAR